MKAKKPPASFSTLHKKMQAAQARLPQEDQHAYTQTIRNTVFTQFMSGDDYIKGGGGIQIRYSLSESRMTQDIDAAFADSADEFRQRLSDRLHTDWEGFTGELIPKEHGPRSLMPEGSAMSPMKIRLFYKGKPFGSIDLEAVPDLPGCAPMAERRMDDGTKKMLEELGFEDVQAPRVMNSIFQLADKLHAISRPGPKRRGRDLVDIALLVGHEAVDYGRLREAARRIERSQRQHDIHMLSEAERESYRNSFDATSTLKSFDECWQTTQAILEQVDEECKSRWLGH
ncbi:MAG: nucleotidyl transferase AbiEii/AbiGii toxin family protein [Bifidobacterium tibiigranuli]|nr:nucleotidyl transferase AbiEii/AbiGii toxin family protein [Bifidobacterium tibiigranuli]